MELYNRTVNKNINDFITSEFIGVGIYGIVVMIPGGVKWRYYCKSPPINKGEFKKIVDDLMMKCKCDVNYVGRELGKLGFEPLLVDESSEYDFRGEVKST